MKKESSAFLRRLLPFLMVPLISVSGVFFLRESLFNDLATLMLFLGICEIVGALFIFFQGLERDLPYHSSHDPLRNAESLTAFFQAKSLMTNKGNSEYKPKLSWLIAWLLCGILLIIGSSFV